MDRKVEADGRITRREFVVASGALCGYGLFANTAQSEALRFQDKPEIIWGLDPTFAVPRECRFRRGLERRFELRDLSTGIQNNTYNLWIRRAADLLNLRFQFSNGRIEPYNGNLYFVANDEDEDEDRRSYFIVHFPPQHVVESYVLGQDLDCGTEPATTQIPKKACLSRPSRLVFKIPPRQWFRLNFSQLLEWQRYSLSLSALAVPNLGLNLPDGGQVVTPPHTAEFPPIAEFETEIVLPDGLVISPHEFMTWDHNVQLSRQFPLPGSRPSSGPIEHWETRAVLRDTFVKKNPDSTAEELKTIRAVLSYPDICNICDHDPLPSPDHCSDIVELSAGFKNFYGPSPAMSQPYNPPPIKCKDLRLAPYGGSIRAKGQWDPLHVYIPPTNESPDVEAYEQQTFQGRDQYVRVETVFFGCPLGVKVTLIQIRKREFIPVQNSHTGLKGTGAVLVERWFSRAAPVPPYLLPQDGSSEIGRRWPFEQVELIWPDKVELKRPVDIFDPMGELKACWMIEKCGTEPLEIEARYRDRQGYTQSIKFPLLLISLNVATGSTPANLATLHDVLERYCSDYDWPEFKKKHYRDVKVAGQKIGFVPAPPPPSDPDAKSGDNRGLFVPDSLRLGVETLDPSWTEGAFPEPPGATFPNSFTESWVNTRVQFYPAVADFRVPIREAEAYSKSGEGVRANFGWNEIYNLVGFDVDAGMPPQNVGEIFLNAVVKENEDLPALEFAGDKGGGLATPSIKIKHFSRKIGNVGGSNAKRALAGQPAAAGQKAALQDGKFDPKEYFGGALSAKLIGDITLMDLLEAVEVLDDQGEIPKLVTEELAEFNEALKQVNELINAFNQVQTLIEDFPDDITEAIQNFSTEAERRIKNEIETRFKDYLNNLIAELVNVEDLNARVTSAVETLRIVLDSMAVNYPTATHEELLKIAKAFDTDVLVHIISEPLAAAEHELKSFVAINVLGPWERFSDFIAQLDDPAKFITGSFIDELEKILNDLKIGTRHGSIEDDVKEIANLFVDRLEAILNRAIDHVHEAIDGAVLTDVGPIIPLIDASLANFPSVMTAAVTARLNEYKAFLRDIEQQWIDQRDQAVTWFRDQIRTITDGIADQLEGVVALYEDIVEKVDDLLEYVRELIAKIPKSVSFTYTWDTPLKSGPEGFPIFVGTNINETATAKLVLNSRIEKKIGLTQGEMEAPPTVDATVSLTDFQIVLIPNMEFVIVGFKRLSIESHGREKPKVTTVLEDVAFGDCLEFVQTLASLFSSGSGFYADVDFTGIHAGYRFAVPTISSGAFNLADLSIGVHFTLPFDGSPIGLGLNVSERHRPCLLSVGIYGGGAYFGLELCPRSNNSGTSVRALESAFEFGLVGFAQIGPAYGKLYVFGGTYFGRRDKVVQLTGYVRAGGCLQVLIISASIEFYVGLTYQKAGDSTQVFGEVTVTVHVKVIFVINVRVALRYVKTFAGSRPEKRLAFSKRAKPADTQVPINYREWLEYCAQFA